MMKVINRKDFKVVLKQHSEWLESKKQKGCKANLENCDLRVALGKRSNPIFSDYGEISLAEANMIGSNLTGVNILSISLSGANLSVASMNDIIGGIRDWPGDSAILDGAILRKAELRGAYLRYSDLSKSDLSLANLRDADLQEANLNGANLTSVDLQNANLKKADLRNTIMTGANLCNANMEDCNLEDALMSNCLVEGTHLQGANLFLHQSDIVRTWVGEPTGLHLIKIRYKEGTKQAQPYSLLMLFPDYSIAAELLKEFEKYPTSSWDLKSIIYKDEKVLQARIIENDINLLFDKIENLAKKFEGYEPVLTNLPQIISKFESTIDRQEIVFRKFIDHQDNLVSQITKMFVKLKEENLNPLFNLLKKAEESNTKFAPELVQSMVNQLKLIIEQREKDPSFISSLLSFVGEVSEHFGLHAAVIPLTHVIEHAHGIEGLIGLSAAGLAMSLIITIKNHIKRKKEIKQLPAK